MRHSSQISRAVGIFGETGLRLLMCNAWVSAGRTSAGRTRVNPRKMLAARGVVLLVFGLRDLGLASSLVTLRAHRYGCTSGRPCGLLHLFLTLVLMSLAELQPPPRDLNPVWPR